MIARLPRLLRPRDVAAQLGLSERTVRRAIAAGRLRAYRPTGPVRVTDADVRDWLDGSELVVSRQPEGPP